MFFSTSSKQTDDVLKSNPFSECKKKESDIPTWTKSDEWELQDLRRKVEESRDQIIWIENQLSYFSYELYKAKDEDAKTKNQRILSGWEERMEYEKILLRNARADQEPLLEKKERFEKYHEHDENED